jgi:uncharacterized protein YkwD
VSRFGGAQTNMPGGRHLSGQIWRVLLSALISMLIVVPAAQAHMGRSERGVVQRINALRAQNGLRPLRADNRLARAADAHSRDMTRKHFFDHPSSNGTSAYNRVRRYRHSSLIGETLAYLPVGASSAAKVVGMWIHSPPHFAVLTTSGFRRIGVARRTGTLNGERVVMWTADLAR